MRTFGVFLMIIVGLISCGGPEKNKQQVQIKKIKAEIAPEDKFDYDTLKGIYSGDFGGSEIRIILNYVSGSNAIGYNIHKGLLRNLKGKVTRSGDSVLMVLHEPGDHEFDGIFNLTFIGNDLKPTGEWESLSKKISKRKFKLAKMIQPKDDDEKITASNFTRFYNYLYDTLGDYRFEDDGLCTYQYYPYKDEETRVEQLIKVRGSWSLTDSILSIDWQPNKRFKNNRMIFITRKNEYEEPYLEGEGMQLYNYWY